MTKYRIKKVGNRGKTGKGKMAEGQQEWKDRRGKTGKVEGRKRKQ